MTFAEKLKARLREQGVSQTELSRRTGISKAIISEYIHGKYEAKQTNLSKIAVALNVNIADIMGDENSFSYVDTVRTIQSGNYTIYPRKENQEIYGEVEAFIENLRTRIIKEHENPYTTFLKILFADRPDIVKAIKSMNLDGSMTFDDMICQLDAQKIDFIRNSVIMSFEQAKMNGKKVAKINVTREEFC